MDAQRGEAEMGCAQSKTEEGVGGTVRLRAALTRERVNEARRAMNLARVRVGGCRRTVPSSQSSHTRYSSRRCTAAAPTSAARSRG